MVLGFRQGSGFIASIRISEYYPITEIINVNPFQFLGRFSLTVIGAFGGPIGLFLGFILGFLLDILLIKKIIKTSRNSENFIGPLFYFWGRWLAENNAVNIQTLSEIKKQSIITMNLSDKDSKTAFLALNHGTKLSLGSKNLFDAAKDLYPRFPLDEQKRIWIMNVCKETCPENSFARDLLLTLAAQFGLEMEENTKKYSPLERAYSVLGLKPTDGIYAAKKSFRKLARQWHPDTVKAGNVSDNYNHYLNIQKAWEFIQTKEKINEV